LPEETKHSMVKSADCYSFLEPKSK